MAFAMALAGLGLACGQETAPPSPVTGNSPTPLPTRPVEVTASAQPTSSPVKETPVPPARELRSIQATHLIIQALGIDVPVAPAAVIRYGPTSQGPPGCPPYGREYDKTLQTPDSGVATADENLAELENKAHIFGHSRWLGLEGIFFRLQDIEVGHALELDGVDRDTGETYAGLQFAVTRIYLGDVESGADILTAWTPEEVPARPIVILQTSVRENGEGKQWILDRDKVLARATNTVEGDLDDTCKYLTLFVIAEPAWQTPLR